MVDKELGGLSSTLLRNGIDHLLDEQYKTYRYKYSTNHLVLQQMVEYRCGLLETEVSPNSVARSNVDGKPHATDEGLQ